MALAEANRSSFPCWHGQRVNQPDYQRFEEIRTGGPGLPSITSDLSTISRFLFSQPAGTCLTICSRYLGEPTKALAASVPYGPIPAITMTGPSVVGSW